VRQALLQVPHPQHGSYLSLLGHVALGRIESVDEAAALVRIAEAVKLDPGAARYYRTLLQAFAMTVEAADESPGWTFGRAAN
jgi:hypothetical protein